jgi:phosphate acetyltransferase/phosphate butyryltransferase
MTEPSSTAVATPSHPRLDALVRRAQERAKTACPRIGLVYPCDAAALDAAARVAGAGLAQPVLIGPRDAMARAADVAGIEIADFEIVDSTGTAAQAAQRATAMARAGDIAVLMKGSLHTDELMSPIVDRHTGLRTQSRISHAFVFDLPRYHKLLALADCVVNIQPNLTTKRDIVSNALGLLQQLEIMQPRVGIVAAVETVNPAIPATLDAQALVEMARLGSWPGALVEGPFGFDNAISLEAARIKKIDSRVAGDADLLLMPDLNAGNMLYKSFIYMGGAECAGLVLGARVPIVLTSRADSLASRIASVALAVLAATQTVD